MAGVERLMVVSHPLAQNPEDHTGPGIIQQAADFLRSYNVTPEVAAVSAGVGVAMSSTFSGAVKGAVVGSIISLVYNHTKSR